MATVPIAPRAVIPAGARSFQAVVPVGIENVAVSLTRNNWPRGTQKNVMTLRVFYSLDNGLTWKFLIGCTADGGPQGGPTTSLGTGLRDPTNPARLLRIDLENVEALDTKISVELT